MELEAGWLVFVSVGLCIGDLGGNAWILEITMSLFTGISPVFLNPLWMLLGVNDARRAIMRIS